MSNEIISECGCCGACCINAHDAQDQLYNQADLYYIKYAYSSIQLNTGGILKPIIGNVLDLNLEYKVFEKNIFYFFDPPYTNFIKYTKIVNCYNDTIKSFNVIQDLKVPQRIECAQGNNSNWYYVLKGATENRIYINPIIDGNLLNLPSTIDLYCRYGAIIELYCIEYKLCSDPNYSNQLNNCFKLDILEPYTKDGFQFDNYIKVSTETFQAAVGCVYSTRLNNFRLKLYNRYTNEPIKNKYITTICYVQNLSYINFAHIDLSNRSDNEGIIYMNISGIIFAQYESRRFRKVMVEFYLGFYFLGRINLSNMTGNPFEPCNNFSFSSSVDDEISVNTNPSIVML